MIKLLCNYLLEQFACTLQEADRLVHLGEAVVRSVGFVEDDDGHLLPQVDASIDGCVEDVDEKLRLGGVGPGEQMVADPTRAWCCVVGHSLEGLRDVFGGDGHPVLGWQGQQVVVLVGVDRSGFCWEEMGLEDLSLELRLVNKGTGGVLEGQEGAGLAAIAGLCQAPYVAVFYSMVQVFMCTCLFCPSEGSSEVSGGLAMLSEGSGESSSCVCGIALLVPPVDTSRVGVALGFKCEAAGLFHGHIEGRDEVLQGHSYKGVTGGEA